MTRPHARSVPAADEGGEPAAADPPVRSPHPHHALGKDQTGSSLPLLHSSVDRRGAQDHRLRTHRPSAGAEPVTVGPTHVQGAAVPPLGLSQGLHPFLHVRHPEQPRLRRRVQPGRCYLSGES